MTPRRRRILLVIGIGALALLIVGGVFVATFDGSGYREDVERLIAEATGRDCSIGDFRIALSLSPRLDVGRFTLANPAWAGDPAMIAVERLSVTLDAWSLVSGPIRIRSLAVDGVAVWLEVDPNAGPNWAFAPPTATKPDPPNSSGGPLEDGLILDDVRLHDVTISYRDAQQHHDVTIADVTSSTDRAGHLSLALEGTLDGEPLRFSGRFGPLVNVLSADGGAVTIDTSGLWADRTLELEGSIADLVALEGLALNLELSGERLETLAAGFPVPRLGSGPYRIGVRTAPQTDGIEVALEVDLDRFRATADATLDRLAPPSRIDATVDAEGPDLARLGAWLDVGIDLAKLPAERFSVKGRVRYAEGATTVEGVHVEVGATRVSADGRIGPPPQMEGTDIAFELSGPDLAAWSPIAGIALPAVTYSAAGHVSRSDAGLVLEGVRASIGDGRAIVEGLVTLEQGLVGSDVILDANGASAAVIGDLAGIALPDERFAVSGRMRREAQSTRVDNLSVILGEYEVQATGTFGDPPSLAGTVLDARASGPELGFIGELIGVDLPHGRFRAEGRFLKRDSGYGLETIDASLGDNTVALREGLIVVLDDDVDLMFDAHATGPSLAVLLDDILQIYAGQTLPFPDAPFDVDGRFEMDPDGYRVKDMTVQVADAATHITGGIGREPAFDRLDATVDASAKSLAMLREYVDLPPLPAGEFEFAGRVTSQDGIYALEGARGRLAENRFRVDGALGRLADFPMALDATLDVSGPDLAAFAELSPDFALPAEAYDVQGRIAVEDDATPDFTLTGVRARLGAATARIDGRLGALPDAFGTDLAVEIERVPPAWFETLAGHELPEDPLTVTGRVGRDADGFVFEGIEITLGSEREPHHATLDGRLGEPPRLEGTALDVTATGPDLSPLALFVDLEGLPDEAYEIGVRFDGTPERFTVSDLAVTFGESDVAGELTIDLRDTPTLSGQLDSKNLDLRPFLPAQTEDGDPPKEMEDAAEQVAAFVASKESAEAPDSDAGKGRKRIFPDDRLDLSALSRINGEVQLSVETLSFFSNTVRSIEVKVATRDGSLIVDPFTMTGQNEGLLSGRLAIRPDPAGYLFSAAFQAEEMRLGVLGHNPVDRMLQPASRVDIVADARGSSVREMMAGLDGHVWVVQGPGQIDNKALGLLSADLLFEIFSTLNPFAKNSKFTDVECGVYVFDIDEGITSIEAIALRTDKMTMGGRGKIDLQTEKLDVSWTSKPRKGVGLSASAITNSYIKLGGSLSKPVIEIKPLEAMVTTGAAVATLGISLLARGMWDRATSGKKVCKKGMKQIEALMAEEGVSFEETMKPAAGSAQ